MEGALKARRGGDVKKARQWTEDDEIDVEEIGKAV